MDQLLQTDPLAAPPITSENKENGLDSAFREVSEGLSPHSPTDRERFIHRIMRHESSLGMAQKIALRLVDTPLTWEERAVAFNETTGRHVDSVQLRQYTKSTLKYLFSL